MTLQMRQAIDAVIAEMRERVILDGPMPEQNDIEVWADRLALLLVEVHQENEFDNHHNALACPYCNPKGLKFTEITPEATNQLIAEADQLIHDRRLDLESVRVVRTLIAIVAFPEQRKE